jgi:hypothetical protein
MRRLIYILMSLSVFAGLSAQDMDEIIVSDTLSLQNDVSLITNDVKPIPKKFYTGVNVNMGYMFSAKGGGPFMTLAPHVTYPLTNKLSLSAGISAGFGNIYLPYLASEGQSGMLPMTQMFIYASGNYQVNEKLSVSGSTYKRIVDVKNPNGSAHPATYSLDYQGVSVGFNYKITNNISFGAQIHVDSPSSEYNSFSPYGFSAPPYGW